MKNKQDYSQARKLYLRNIKKNKITTYIWQISILIALLGVWELLAGLQIIDTFFVSCPSRKRG